ncbi:MAG: RNA methyltransferase, partial [Clostridia bacterium]|nr:RNA methyltransferase [Clostridia bacterium]
MKENAFLCHRGQELSFPVILTPKEEIEKRASGSSHGGVLALCTGRTFPSLLKEHLSEGGFYVMMEGIEDPYNFGYALRSLYAAG